MMQQCYIYSQFENYNDLNGIAGGNDMNLECYGNLVMGFLNKQNNNSELL